MNFTILYILAFISDLVELTYDLGQFTRNHVLPALVYCYVLVEYYVAPALSIPGNYLLVRRLRLNSAPAV